MLENSSYSHLKKLIYMLEKSTIGIVNNNELAEVTQSDIEEQPLLRQSEEEIINFPKRTTTEEANSLFSLELDKESEKIVEFYTRKELAFLDDIAKIAKDILNREKLEEQNLQQQNATSPTIFPPRTPSAQPSFESLPPSQLRPESVSPHTDAIFGTGSITVQADEYPIFTSSYLSTLIWSSLNLKSVKAEITRRVLDIYVLLCELRDFVEINETGFSTKSNLNQAIDYVTSMYARVATDGKIIPAQTDLKSHLKERVVWERNTIWRDMVEQERRQQSIGFVSATDPLDVFQGKGVKVLLFGCPIYVPRIIPFKVLVIIVAILALVFFCNGNIFQTPEQNNCFGILIFSSILWAFEALPLFITSIIVPFLVVSLRVMRVDGVRLDAKKGAKLIFSDMFGPVIMLLLGGFSLAGALSKYNIAKEAASFILGKAGSKPRWVLLANMFVSTFASMWISNVAAPVLCFSLISPILRNLPSRSNYAKCLVIGIAMAANVGGMASPIASPQNIIAVATMTPAPSWLEWFTIAIPICIVLDLAIWLILLMLYQPKEESVPPELYTQRSIAKEAFNGTQLFVIAITIITIFLWIIEGSIEGIVGDMGVIAILPIVCFYGTGILTKDDWNSMLWSVVMLAMGGIALGKAVESSGLLTALTIEIQPFLQKMPLFYSLALIAGIVVVITSFISHTVGALILLPVVAQIGSLLPDPRPRTFVMTAALLCSGGMCLPVSSFPNMNAISLEDSKGTPWLTVEDFLKIGVVSSILAWLIILAIGYTVMTLMGFH